MDDGERIDFPTTSDKKKWLNDLNPVKKDFQQLSSQATPLPYSVDSLDDLPQTLLPPAWQSIETTDEIISICVFPGTTRLKSWHGWENIPEQALLFTNNGILHVQAPASTHQAAKIIYLRASDLLCTRLSLLLMHGQLQLISDCLCQVVVEFNAAGFDILQQGLQNLLRTSCGENSIFSTNARPTDLVLNDLGRLSFKFKNGLHLYGLLPKEHLLGFVFQPSLWKPGWHLTPSKASETTLLALTDKQLIIVEERSKSRFPAYGWIFTFYPRRVISQIGFRSSSPWQEMIIEINGRAELPDHRILLERENGLVWQDLWSRFGNLLPGA